MSKSSVQIRKEAKQIRKKNRQLKLTDVQNALAEAEGYGNFKHLLTQEQARAAEKRAFPVKPLCPPLGKIVGHLNERVAIYSRPDGQRSLKALADFAPDETLFIEIPFIWAYLKEDIRGEGLGWALTRKIATEFPDQLLKMERDLKFRETFRPKLDKSDLIALANIASDSAMSSDKVRKIYNLVCTYNVIFSFRALFKDRFIVGERMAISKGLGYANHSCEPNATRLPATTLDDFTANEAGLIAIRQIEAGEEICWSYLPEPALKQGVKLRQKKLKNEFGFKCTCPKCCREISGSGKRLSH